MTTRPGPAEPGAPEAEAAGFLVGALTAVILTHRLITRGVRRHQHKEHP